MHKPASRLSLLACAGFVALAVAGSAAAEPPMRAARLAYVDGTVSFSPAGQPDWVQASPNRPLTSGDRLWVAPDARAELQVGGAALRLGAATSVTLLNLDDRIAQVQLSEGTLKVRVRRLGPDQVFEVDTPNLAFTMRRAGDYRIDVDANGDATAVMVQSGQGEVYGEGASYTVTPQAGYRFYGTGLSDYERITGNRADALDRWARVRDRSYDNSASARYVSPDVVGYQDLDANGAWRVEPEYGNVWTPARVASGWTPYRDGHWAWVDPWGWTWVDDAPWGYAVSHYGRWANIRGNWSWVPGPPREQAVYAPALVAFVGGDNLQVALSVGGAIAAAVGWFPLAPREVFQPAYPVSRGYFNNINRSNAVIAPAAITNVYNSTTVNNTSIVNNTTNVTRVVYANQRVAGAVVAVPAQAFVQSRPVAGAALVVSKDAAAGAAVAHVAAVAPVAASLHGGARDAARPPGREKGIVARTAPPAPPVAFAAQQQQLAARPGRPVEETLRKQMKPVVAATPPPAVSVVTTAQAAAPSAPPPATPPAGKSADARKAESARGEAGRADARKGDAGRAADPRPDASKADAAKANASKADAAKADASKADASKADAAKADALKVEAAKADGARIAAARAASLKAEASKLEAAKADAMKADGARAEAARAASVKADASRSEAAKAEAARGDAIKVEAARAAGAKAEATRADAARGEAAKADAARQVAAKAAADRAALAKAEVSRAESARIEAAKADVARTAAANAEATRAGAAKAEASRAEAAKAAKAADANAQAAKLAAAKADAAKAEARKAEAARAAAAREEASKGEARKGDAPRDDTTRPPDERRKGDEDPRRR